MTNHTLEKRKTLIHDIFLVLSKNEFHERDIGLLSGKMGVALFLYEYSRFTKRPEIKRAGEELLKDVINRINRGFNVPTFCDGIYGIAWCFDYLIENGDLNLDETSLFGVFDETLEDSLRIHFKEKKYDFLHGYLGIGIYLLKRFENSESNDDKKNYRKHILKIVGQLKEDSIINEDFIYWLPLHALRKSENDINLGLAHGLSSIINFLSRLVRFDDFADAVLPLLNKIIDTVLSLKSDYGPGLSIFPNTINFTNVMEKGDSRLAWCNGDLGIGVSLWNAANLTKDKSIEKEAVDILIHASKRRSLDKNFVRDAGLCHGAFGIMLIFDHLYKSTRITQFKDATNYWLAQGMAMDISEESTAGFMSRQFINNKWIWKKEVDILDGIAGIGLALINSLSKEKLAWSNCLMIACN